MTKEILEQKKETESKINNVEKRQKARITGIKELNETVSVGETEKEETREAISEQSIEDHHKIVELRKKLEEQNLDFLFEELNFTYRPLRKEFEAQLQNLLRKVTEVEKDDLLEVFSDYSDDVELHEQYKYNLDGIKNMLKEHLVSRVRGAIKEEADYFLDDFDKNFGDFEVNFKDQDNDNVDVYCGKFLLGTLSVDPRGVLKGGLDDSDFRFFNEIVFKSA